ncbi:hypothetical protein ACJX0J_024819, partial [Zea mays]
FLILSIHFLSFFSGFSLKLLLTQYNVLISPMCFLRNNNRNQMIHVPNEQKKRTRLLICGYAMLIQTAAYENMIGLGTWSKNNYKRAISFMKTKISLAKQGFEVKFIAFLSNPDLPSKLL